MFLVVVDQNSTSQLKSVITVYLWNTWHVMLSLTKFQKVGIAICHVMLISSTLITCGQSNHRRKLLPVGSDWLQKKRKAKNNGNCKAFSVTRKRNKTLANQSRHLKATPNKSVFILLKVVLMCHILFKDSLGAMKLSKSEFFILCKFYQQQLQALARKLLLGTCEMGDNWDKQIYKLLSGGMFQ